MVRKLASNRELILRLFIRDFTSKYKQTLLGFAWAVLTPLLMVATFVFLSRANVLNVGDVGVPYALWALIGIAVWELFRTGLVVCCNSIVAGGSMVVKINFPKETLVFASFGQALIDLAVRLVLIIIAFIAYGIMPAWTAVFFPFSLIPLILLTLGLGLLLSLLNALIRDVANVVAVAVSFLMFLTPVLYPARDGLFGAFNKYNPLAPLIEVPRSLLLQSESAPSGGYWVIAVLSVLVFLFCWRTFAIAEVRIAERMGSR